MSCLFSTYTVYITLSDLLLFYRYWDFDQRAFDEPRKELAVAEFLEISGIIMIAEVGVTDLFVICFIEDLQAMLTEVIVDAPDQVIAEADLVFLHPLLLGDLRGGQRVGYAFGIRADQAACTKLDAVEIADGDGDDILHVIAVEAFQHRDAGGAGRLAVIVAALDLIMLADDESIAVMRSVRMQAPDGREERFCVRFALCAVQISDEAALFDFHLFFMIFFDSVHVITAKIII